MSAFCCHICVLMSTCACAWHPEQAAALASIMTDLQLEVFSLRKAEPALQGLLGQVLSCDATQDWLMLACLHGSPHACG